ncbi:D-aminoacyl-tRNA deacylase [Haloflavibacter putidus]|uniref:D-aminoacyl-tRNA deacylase n=1 Tax=Haloflavibacter putidus TaxID=2576776 RepID=A0A507ZVV8_9FLAO|nr:D-aminoacyl-tRNA deacylase [Haloflavibacter putidus]TQD39828.1 D-tyrosyl-tRNA(Tyr) deacylase [Haloflavibacter putidus]
MRAVIQRVKKANVSVGNELNAVMQQGLLILLGIEAEDTKEDIDWLVRKICNMRIFSDQDGNMNLSLKDIDGEAIIVSQFTLYANTKKGNRPSFIKAAKPAIAKPLYEKFIQEFEEKLGKRVGTGKFGADMQINLVNDGPVTIIIDSKE